MGQPWCSRRSKNDEFYTNYDSIEYIYKTGHIDLDYFKDKKIYCNCDDYRTSNYVRWWKDNFKEIGIKHLTATNYDNGDGAYIYNYDGENEDVEKGIGDGSYEHYDYLIDNDTIISTNPPFSKARAYFNFLRDNDAKYYVHNTILNTAKYCADRLDLIFINRYKGDLINYDVPSWNAKNVGVTASGIVSNIGFVKTGSGIKLTKKYDDITKDFYEAEDFYKGSPWKGRILNIDSCKNIPIDYDGDIGVPISFLIMQPEYRKMFKACELVNYGNKFFRIRIRKRDE